MNDPCESSQVKARVGRAATRAGAVLASILGLSGLCAIPVSDELQAAAPPFLFQDTDHDGLADAFETYLSTASTDPALDANPLQADTDGDQLPDGFEYCLSHGADVTTANRAYSIVPTLTLGTQQFEDELLITVYAIPGDLVSISEFHFLAAVLTASGPVLLDLTELFARNVEAVGGALFGPYSMAALRVRMPVAWLEAFDSVTFGVGGSVSGVKMGDTAIVSAKSGRTTRWRFQAVSGFTSGDGDLTGNGEPQGFPPSSAIPNSVCHVSVSSVPTSISGITSTVTVSAGCQAATWVCYPTDCAVSAAAGAPKLLLDVLQLF